MTDKCGLGRAGHLPPPPEPSGSASISAGPCQTTTLTNFLLARIAEDEADARQLVEDLGRWDRERAFNGPDGTQGSIVTSTLRGGAFDPARVLAECEAKRRIVQRVVEAMDAPPDEWTYVILCDLALPYADHPDYREEWKP